MPRCNITRNKVHLYMSQFVKSRAIVFDLDGVLVDSKEVHFESLNRALSDIDKRFEITKKEQEFIFEGLPTTSKLDILTITKGLPKTLHDIIWRQKQAYSSQIFSNMNQDRELINIFSFIKSKDIKIGVASNAIRETVDSCIRSLGLYEFVDLALSNEDVVFPKPDPEIYLSMMKALGSDQLSTAIFEDSNVGRQAAIASGAKLFPIESRSSVSMQLISEAVKYLDD